MFTGIVEEVGRVVSLDARASGARLTVACREVLADAAEGASIAVNGVCLTAVALEDGRFAADLAPETLARSNLAALRVGAKVNLERPLRFGGRLDGHLVQGHVDATATIGAVDQLGDGNFRVRFTLDGGDERYVVEKGSIAVDGISLTVAGIEGREVTVAIVPHTWTHTALSDRRVGDRVNIELDLIAKLIAKLVAK